MTTRSRLLIPFALVTGLLLWTTPPSLAASAAKADPATKASSAKNARIDINTASKAELTSISGVDDASAQKIINGRPYTRKRQLVSKGIVPRATYDKIKDEIVAKESKK